MPSLSAEFHRFHDKARPVIGTRLYGLVASLAAVAFQVSINWLYARCFKLPADGGFVRFAEITFVVVVVTSLLVGWLLSAFCPEAAGSGVPQVKLQFWKEFGHSAAPQSRRLNFITEILSIGGEQFRLDSCGCARSHEIEQALAQKRPLRLQRALAARPGGFDSRDAKAADRFHHRRRRPDRADVRTGNPPHDHASNEFAPHVYVVRVCAFALIFGAEVDKNRSA